MKTLGFDNYIGCGNGLEKEMNCKWLPMDTDLINVTTPKYLNQEGNFVTYYITVSGHSPYNSSSRPAKKYLDLVEGEYSTAVKYYLASQIELDRALEQLIVEAENVIIMGHTNSDIDCIGSALGIYRLAKTLKKDRL